MIDSFTGKHRFLSNFYIDEYGFCVEIYYQSMKPDNMEEVRKILNCANPAAAKKYGQKVMLRSNWEDIKLSVMEKLVRKKFENPYLAKLLLGTNDEELIEGNWWGDTYWGVCNGVGENHLGKILMQVRKELSSSPGGMVYAAGLNPAARKGL